MDNYLEKTREFSEVMGQPVNRNILSDEEGNVDLIRLRKRLVTEEYFEFMEEVKHIIDQVSLGYSDTSKKKVLEALVKEYADLQYVLSGFAATFGLPAEEIFMRVHESNLSKLGDDGKPIFDTGGKVQKGPNYHKAILADIIDKYVAEHTEAE